MGKSHIIVEAKLSESCNLALETVWWTSNGWGFMFTHHLGGYIPPEKSTAKSNGIQESKLNSILEEKEQTKMIFL